MHRFQGVGVGVGQILGHWDVGQGCIAWLPHWTLMGYIISCKYKGTGGGGGVDREKPFFDTTSLGNDSVNG
jgi:hypothetical protein